MIQKVKCLVKIHKWKPLLFGYSKCVCCGTYREENESSKSR